MKKIIWTCDTEIGELGHLLDNAYDVLVFGKVQGREAGIGYMNRIARQFGASITHFVDVYQAKYQNNIINACESILSNGHKLALHTHPRSMYGKRYMCEYSLPEQQKIIEYGQSFFKSYVNVEIGCHRAGGYGADVNTMKALQEAGIYKDSSYYYSTPACMLPFDNINSVFWHGKVLEIPVTVYNISMNFLGYNLFKKHRVQKLDFRYGSSVGEILTVIDRMEKDSVIILFLHSFNFLDLKYSAKKHKFISISVNDKLMHDYQVLLNEISNRSDCCWGILDDIHEEYPGSEIDINRPINIAKSLKRRFSNYIYV